MTNKTTKQAHKLINKARTVRNMTVTVLIVILLTYGILSMAFTTTQIYSYVTTHHLEWALKIVENKHVDNSAFRRDLLHEQDEKQAGQSAQSQPTEPTISPFKKFLTPQANDARNKILNMLQIDYKDRNQQIAFDNILKKEAGYRADATNEIGACGMGQALPCSKMPCALSYSDTDVTCQYNWIKGYVTRRYGSPVVAWNFHLANNWY